MVIDRAVSVDSRIFTATRLSRRDGTLEFLTFGGTGGGAMNLDLHTFVPRHDLCRGDPRTAAAVRLGPEFADPRRGLVGMRAPDAGRFDRAVRHVWRGVAGDLDRLRQCTAVPVLCRDLDRRARVRRAQAAAAGDRRRVAGLADRLLTCRRSASHSKSASCSRPASSRPTLGSRPTSSGADAPSRWCRDGRRSSCCSPTVRCSCCARRWPPCCRGRPSVRVRERVADGAQLRGTDVHDLDRLHPAGDGEGAHRVPSTGPRRWSIR